MSGRSQAGTLLGDSTNISMYSCRYSKRVLFSSGERCQRLGPSGWPLSVNDPRWLTPRGSSHFVDCSRAVPRRAGTNLSGTRR